MCTGAALIIIACSVLSGSAKAAVITLGIIDIVCSIFSMAHNMCKAASKRDKEA